MATMLVFENPGPLIRNLRQAANEVPDLEIRICDNFGLFKREWAEDFPRPPDIVLMGGSGVGEVAVPEILAYLRGLWGSLPSGRIFLAISTDEAWLVSASNVLFGEGYIRELPRKDPRWRDLPILLRYLLNQAGVGSERS